MKIVTIFNARFAWLILALFAFTTCVDKNYDFSKLSNEITYNPTLALSIGSTTFTVDQILSHYDSTGNFLNQDAQGMFYIVYQKNLLSFQASDKIPVPAQLPIVIPSFVLSNFDSNGQSTKLQSLTIPMEFNSSQKIDSIILKSLIMNVVDGSSTYSNSGQLIVSFPTITKNGNALTSTINIPANASNFNTTNSNIADGYKLTFSSVYPDSSMLPINVTFKLIGGTPNSAVGAGIASFKIELDSIRYHILYGYAGQETLLDISDSLSIPSLNTALIKNIDWADPEIFFFLRNSYVLPIQYNILNMMVHSDVTNQNYQVVSNLSHTSRVPATLGASASDTLILSRTTTPLLATALQQSPKYVQFHLKAISNPSGITGTQNITLDTSSIKTSMQLYLPIWFKSGGFGITDTMNFDLSKSLPSSSDSIQSMLFRLSSTNGMPIDMSVQVIFTDSLYTPLDSLFKGSSSPQIVKHGTVAPEPVDTVTSSTILVKDVTFDKPQLQHLLKTKKILIKVSLKTANYSSQYVKILATNKLKLHFECQFQPKITVRL